MNEDVTEWTHPEWSIARIVSIHGNEDVNLLFEASVILSILLSLYISDLAN